MTISISTQADGKFDEDPADANRRETTLRRSRRYTGSGTVVGDLLCLLIVLLPDVAKTLFAIVNHLNRSAASACGESLSEYDTVASMTGIPLNKD